MPITAVLFDFIGTTVKEKTPDTLLNCIRRAFDAHHIPVNSKVLQANRGKDKFEMIISILNEQGQGPSLAASIYETFRKNIERSIDNFCSMEFVPEIFSYLREKNIMVGIGSGMEREMFETIFSHLQWKRKWFDYMGISKEIGRGRPYPDMIWDMMKMLNIESSSSVLKVGDTVNDVLEGKNAGALTVAIASGTHSFEMLKAASADHIIHSLSDLKLLFD